MKYKILKLVFFILMISIPFLDQVLGYATYKNLCKNDSGIKVFRTLNNKKEQKDYWLMKFLEFNAYIVKHDNIYHHNLDYKEILSKDFSKIYNVYYPRFYSKDSKKDRNEILLSIEKVFYKNRKSELSILFEIEKAENSLIKKEQKDLTLQEIINNSNLFPTIVINKNRDKILIERAYKNLCNDEYNNFSADSIEYKKSCTFTNQLIKNYNLVNIINIPKSHYKIIENKTLNKDYIKYLNIYPKTREIYSSNTNEVLATNKQYIFKHGWYLNTISNLIGLPKPKTKCIQKMDTKAFEELVIANYFKNN